MWIRDWQAEEISWNVEVVGEGAVAPAAHAAAHPVGRGEDARNQEEGDTAGMPGSGISEIIFIFYSLGFKREGAIK